MFIIAETKLCVIILIASENISMIIIIKYIDFSLNCDIIFIEIKNVETKDGCHDTNSYYDMRLFNLNYGEPICCSRRLTFYFYRKCKAQVPLHLQRYQ